MDPNKTKIVKNVASLVVGGILGLYFGQYFPDMYYIKIQ